MEKPNGYFEKYVVDRLDELKQDVSDLTNLITETKDNMHKMELQLVKLQTEIRTKARFTGALYGGGTAAAIGVIYEIIEYSSK